MNITWMGVNAVRSHTESNSHQTRMRGRSEQLSISMSYEYKNQGFILKYISKYSNTLYLEPEKGKKTNYILFDPVPCFSVNKLYSLGNSSINQ